MTRTRNIIIAHGVLMSLAFVIFYPLGAVLIRVLGGKGAIQIHAGTQAFAYILALAGFGMGVWIAKNIGAVRFKPPTCLPSYRPSN